VAGQCVVGLSIDEEADLCDVGQNGVQRSDDRVQGEQLGYYAGGVVIDEGAVQADYGNLPGRRTVGVGHQEDIVDGWTALKWMS
jgi:hypothetical protein